MAGSGRRGVREMDREGGWLRQAPPDRPSRVCGGSPIPALYLLPHSLPAGL